MPYITNRRRKELMADWRGPQTPGELNYILTRFIIGYVMDKGLSYQTVNDVIGALEGAKLEFYRRQVAQYEDTKIKENGDVYVGISR